MASPVHVIGGGLAGSEAAWQLARAGVPVVLHEMRPVRGTDAHQTDGAGRAGLLQLVPLRRRGEQRRRPAARGDAALRLADHGARAIAHKLPAGGALAVDRDGFSDGGAPRRSRPHPLVTHRARGDRRPAAAPTGASVIVATGPLTSPALAEAIRAAHRRGRARLLRRHRADRPSRQHRHGGRLVPVALRQAGTGRHRRRLHQLPDRPGAVRGLHRRAARRREDALQGVGDARRPISRAACRSR